MPVGKVRADHDALKQLAQKFGQSATTTGQMIKNLKNRMGVLRGRDWVGKGADKFYAEMDAALFPSLTRLEKSFTSAQRITLQIGQIMKQAEDDATALFKGGDGNTSKVITKAMGSLTGVGGVLGSLNTVVSKVAGGNKVIDAVAKAAATVTQTATVKGAVVAPGPTGLVSNLQKAQVGIFSKEYVSKLPVDASTPTKATPVDVLTKALPVDSQTQLTAKISMGTAKLMGTVPNSLPEGLSVKGVLLNTAPIEAQPLKLPMDVQTKSAQLEAQPVKLPVDVQTKAPQLNTITSKVKVSSSVPIDKPGSAINSTPSSSGSIPTAVQTTMATQMAPGNSGESGGFITKNSQTFLSSKTDVSPTTAGSNIGAIVGAVSKGIVANATQPGVSTGGVSGIAAGVASSIAPVNKTVITVITGGTGSSVGGIFGSLGNSITAKAK